MFCIFFPAAFVAKIQVHTVYDVLHGTKVIYSVY